MMNFTSDLLFFQSDKWRHMIIMRKQFYFNMGILPRNQKDLDLAFQTNMQLSKLLQTKFSKLSNPHSLIKVKAGHSFHNQHSSKITSKHIDLILRAQGFSSIRKFYQFSCDSDLQASLSFLQNGLPSSHMGAEYLVLDRNLHI